MIAVQEALGEQFDESTVDVFGQGAVLLYYRIVQHERTIQVVELLGLADRGALRWVATAARSMSVDRFPNG